MDNMQILPEDLVFIRLTCRARDTKEAVELNETVRVRELPLQGGGGGGVAAPALPEGHAELLASADPTDREKAVRMLAEYNDAVADFMADGGETPAEGLAQAVVSWVVETRPGGHDFTSDNTAREGYIVSPGEINIAGPQQLGEDRVWRVTAVGTWG